MTVDSANPYRGADLHGYRAEVASGLSPRLFRYLSQASGPRLAIGSVVICSLLMIAALIGGDSIRAQGGARPTMLGIAIMLGGLLAGLIALFMAFLGVVATREELKCFRDGLLIPGVVVSKNPTVVVALADMGRTAPGSAYALTQSTLRSVGTHSREPGTRIPCFASFTKDNEPERWNTVSIHLISWGTADPNQIQQCFDRLGEEPFRRLEECVRRGPVPSGDLEQVMLDPNLEPVGVKSNA